VASRTIAEALPFINWVVLMSLAVGAVGLVVALRAVTDATRGYLAFTAFLAGFLGFLVLASDPALPLPQTLAIHDASNLDGPRRLALVAFVVLTFATGIELGRGRRARWVGIAAIAAGIIAMGLAAFGWAGDALHAVPLFVQMVLLSVVTGASAAAVVLAHWYLVSPRLSERPLVLTTRILVRALGLQLLIFLTWQAVGGDRPFASFTGDNALFVWLRLIVGLIFPLVLSWLAEKTAETRSMESATGLLYINLAAVLASTIVAVALYDTTGLLT